MHEDLAYSANDIQKKLPELRAEFEAAHGKNAFNKVYIEHLNEEVITKLPYNRNANLHLVAYFMSAALNKSAKELNAILNGFKDLASEEGAGNDGSYNDEIFGKIVDATEKAIEKLRPTGGDTHDDADTGPSHDLIAA